MVSSTFLVYLLCLFVSKPFYLDWNLSIDGFYSILMSDHSTQEGMLIFPPPNLSTITFS